MAYDSSVILCGYVPLDPRYEHTLKFEVPDDQEAYFYSLMKYERMTDLTYLRKNHYIQVDIRIRDLEGVNYLYTKNPGEKTRYYFIERKEYLSESATRLHVTLDVMQTYQHDWIIPPCFVEREHVLDDSLGANMIDEGLELGEYVTNSEFSLDFGELAIVIQSSVTLTNPIGEPITGGIIGNVYNGLALYTRTLNATGALVVDAVIKSLETSGKADGIANMWVYPKRMINADFTAEDDATMLLVKGIQPFTFSTIKNVALGGYVPKNKKLLTYPYNLLYVHNNMGECALYHYELFSSTANNGLPGFRVAGNIGADGTVRLMPCNYAGVAENNEEGLSLTGFPTCSWTQDAYKIWLAQNANTQALSIQSGQISVGVGVGLAAAGAVQAAVPFGGGGGDLIASGVSHAYSGYQQIAGVMAARKDAQVQPPQAKGAQSSSCNITDGKHTFQLCARSIQAGMARSIDDYFQMYGYKVNQVKYPNITGRKYWNYVRTIGAVIQGNIDAEDRAKIAMVLDKGVTFWHEPGSMYNYFLTNGVS